MKTIKAIFKGANGSLGYITGKEYTLTLKEFVRGGIWICNQETGKQVCEYSNFMNFLDNWTNIKEI
jgi:hypothetical protein